MKKILIGILTTLMILAFPLQAFASDLKALYNSEMSSLIKAGYGQYKNDPSKPIPIPSVETPPGYGKSAKDVFNTKYGDMWNDPKYQLDKTSIIPDDSYFQNIMDQYQKKGSDLLNPLWNKQLDLTKTWDFQAIKNSYHFMTPDEINNVLANASKPAGWDAAFNYNSTPNLSTWLSGTPFPAGYGQMGGVDQYFMSFLSDNGMGGSSGSAPANSTATWSPTMPSSSIQSLYQSTPSPLDQLSKLFN